MSINLLMYTTFALISSDYPKLWLTILLYSSVVISPAFGFALFPNKSSVNGVRKTGAPNKMKRKYCFIIMTFKWFLFCLFWDFFLFYRSRAQPFSRFGSMISWRRFYGIYFTFRALLIKEGNQAGYDWVDLNYNQNQSAWVAPRVYVRFTCLLWKFNHSRLCV